MGRDKPNSHFWSPKAMARGEEGRIEEEEEEEEGEGEEDQNQGMS